MTLRSFLTKIYLEENNYQKFKRMVKMQKFDVIIVGGGASGVMTALTCSKRIKNVAIIDSGSYVGKKLLSTGNGRCNLTNLNMNSSFYNQNIDLFLKKFDEKSSIKFFNSLGLVIKADDCGRVYPFSNVARSVVDVFENKINEQNIAKLTGKKVINIEKIFEGFVVTTEQDKRVEKFFAKKIVLATGGNSIVEILKNLGIKFSPFFPSLVALKTKESTKQLSGVRVSDVRIFATSDIAPFDPKKEEFGEILFKDKGLSGIAVLNLSTYFARNKNFFGKVFIDFVPKIEEKELIKLLNSRKMLSGNILIGFLNEAVAREIFDRLKLNFKMQNSFLTDNNILEIARLIKHFEFTVCEPYDNNQVFCGGVPLLELSENLESKFVPNLFVCGELCDVDGETGGYNLQWAWTSGNIVGENL
ncbi:MAG: aminoacetone oxidase family FAD-binding enzyme [Clostridia bacterium]|nr:aminoacetone oxidase family FAD-binding enzyme [Clostridia bacterium]